MRPHRARWSAAILALPLAAACDASTPPPVAPPPPAAAPPAIADGYADLPPADRVWGPAEYQAASVALKARLDRDPRSLPPVSSAVFARLVDRSNIAFATDPRLSIQQRQGALDAVMQPAAAALRVYTTAAARGAPADGTLLLLGGFVLAATRLQWEMADELLAGTEPTDAQIAGLARMRRGTAEEVGGILALLHGHHPRVIPGFVATAREDLAALVQRLPPGGRRAPILDLEGLRARDPAKRDAADALLAAIAALPPPDFTVTSTAILGPNPAAPIALLPADRTGGVDARDKRSGPNDLYIVPLANALPASPAAARHRATIAFDPTTPYRLLIEVLFTLGQNQIATYALRPMGDASRTIVVTPPRIGGSWQHDVPRLNLSVWVVGNGIAIKASSGNLAPGCAGVGAGLAIPRAGARHDLAAFDACLRRLKALAPEEGVVTLVANPSVPASDVFDVADALRGAGDDLFPTLHFGVAR